MEATKNIVLGDDSKLTNFESCQQYIKTVVGNRKHHRPDDEKRQVSSLQRKPKKDTKKPKDRIRAGHYEMEEWKALSEEEKAKVFKLREEKKTKRKVSSISTDPGKEGNKKPRVETIADDPPESEGEDTSTASDDVPIGQFGRKAHKKAKADADKSDDKKASKKAKAEATKKSDDKKKN